MDEQIERELKHRQAFLAHIQRDKIPSNKDSKKVLPKTLLKKAKLS